MVAKVLEIFAGISTMMWSTFIVKRFSAAAFLMEKVTLQVRICHEELYQETYQNLIFSGWESTQRSLMSTGELNSAGEAESR